MSYSDLFLRMIKLSDRTHHSTLAYSVYPSNKAMLVSNRVDRTYINHLLVQVVGGLDGGYWFYMINLPTKDLEHNCLTIKVNQYTKTSYSLADVYRKIESMGNGLF